MRTKNRLLAIICLLLCIYIGYGIRTAQEAIHPTQTPMPEVIYITEVITEYIEVPTVLYPMRIGIVTAYCPCEICSEGWGHQTTSGIDATENHTIAMENDVYPIGTEVKIGGFGDTIFVVMDDGGWIHDTDIDVFMESHDATVEFGVQERRFQVIKWGSGKIVQK